MNFMKNTTQIGAIFYSNAVSSIIGLSESKVKHSLETRLKHVKRTHGRGRVDEAIRYIRTKGFRRSVIRKDATQIGIIITASPGTYIRKSKRQATKARETGIILIAVGIGDINTEELNAISGTMDGSLQYHFPSARFLSANLANIAYNVCKIDRNAVTAVSDKACGSRQEADFMFMLDGVNAGKTNTRKTLAFIQDLLKDVDVSPRKVRVGVMSTEPKCVNEFTGFDLNTYKRNKKLNRALEKFKGVDVAAVVKKLRQNMIARAKGGRKGAKKIAILFIDEGLEDPVKAFLEAERASIQGIEVYIVKIGKGLLQENEKVEQMVNDEGFKHQSFTENNIYHISNYDELPDIKREIWYNICDEL
uniref:VWFA domain-containing protein n=2 Tax=Magallana gigas TaxID=29159 RepID=A0A8W8KE97_MAGGI